MFTINVPMIVPLIGTSFLLMVSGLGIYWFVLDRILTTKTLVEISSKHIIHLFLGGCSLVIFALVLCHVSLSEKMVVSIVFFMGMSFTCSALWDRWWLFQLRKNRQTVRSPLLLRRVELVCPVLELLFGILGAAGGGVLVLQSFFHVNNREALYGIYFISVITFLVVFQLLIDKWYQNSNNN